jgi:23S rRNA pseudouridine1911/1915/1917 synthase
MSQTELPILFEDNHCLAVCKPACLLTQAPAGIPSAESLAKTYLKERYSKAGNVYLGIPHRLDRPVSGVLLLARSSKAAARLAEQFHQRQVKKLYRGLVEHSMSGEPVPEEANWDDWLLKHPEEARTERVEAGTPGAKEARLAFRRLYRGEDGSLVEIEPVTGRSHQIRVQFACRGWPVRGDALYGARLAFGPASGAASAPRDRVIALHAWSLTFLHPIRYEPVTVTAPLPAIWAEFLPADVAQVGAGSL